MRIAILGSVALPVPPMHQGGTEWMAYYQAKGLADKGHKVTLFASKGSKKENYNLIEVGGGDTVVGSSINGDGGPAPHNPIRQAQGKPSRQDSSAKSVVHAGGIPSFGSPPSLLSPSSSHNSPPSSSSPSSTHGESVESSRNLRKEIVYLTETLEKLKGTEGAYDVVLNNMRGEAIFLPTMKEIKMPFVSVCHLPLFEELSEIYKRFETSVITISNAQRKRFPDLNYLATVYNCVDSDRFTFSEKGEGYMLMMGSISPHKNQAGAVRIAKKMGKKLVLAGKINDQKYFESFKDEIDGNHIEYYGELKFEDKLKLYQKADLFIFPILWEEPFGLVMIEALSCGTPVVAFGNGAIPEVLVNGSTGFVIENNSEEKMIAAIKIIDKIDRKKCRDHVIQNFTVSKMVDGYEKALRKLVTK